MAELNPAQQQAVQAEGGPQLILAGAGSGKTRTVVHRIGHLISVRDVAPHRVLAVTFTNKAAAELKSRLTEMIGDDAGGVVSGTFHAVSLRFLRRYADALGYPRSFQVVDADDQKILIKRLLKAHNIAAERLHPSYLLGWIEHCKHAGLTPSEAPEHGWNGVDMRELYGEYQAELKRLERMDFSDLILNVVLLFRDHPDVAAALRGRFDHVLVDEYQDTNPVQHEWLIRLCDEHRNLTVVGDDDQSIYGWRGADIRHILDFDKLWGGAGTHRLEENYRSTGAILKLANAVIQANSDRHAKELRATREEGALPEWQVCNDEYDEARKICRLIQRWRDQGRPWSEIAVLYRSNRQSLPLEQIMRESGIPYRIVGGVGFFERMEIKDALAYWSLLNQCGDALHLLRICNKPKRGIGAKGMEQLAEQLAASGMRVAEWLDIVADGQAGGTAKKIEGLACLLRDMRSNIAQYPDYGLNDILDASGYLKSLDAMGELEAAARLENIHTLQAYIELSMSEGLTPIEFMDRAALLQGTEDMRAGEDEREEDAISMMSLHRAKGLEFDCVALAGIEEGMLPHQRAVDEGETGISEERRLLYVGITRARTHLMLTSARQRRLFGDTHYPQPSRFIKQLPRDILQRERTAQEPGFSMPAGTGVNLGGNVRHPSFGEGVVISLEGAGDAVRVTVEFRRAGIKRLMLKYASLEPV